MEFERKIRLAEAMRLADAANRQYWSGFQAGVQQAQLGGQFGSDEQHHQMMTMGGDSDRDAIGQGYRDGYGGQSPDPAGSHGYRR
jgi:hypothetical protein